jgi:hypothetical protein
LSELASQSPVRYGGVRSSRILGNYPGKQFPAPKYWSDAAKWMANKFTNAAPVAVWIVSLAGDNGESFMGFPADGKSYPNVVFANTEYNEAHLSAFDTSGIKVWLQVESGSANMDTLIDLVLSRYSHHSCVIGFGIDVEWLDWKTNSGGRKLTDSLELIRWENRVRKYDSTYTLFVKHYSSSWMPSKFRGNLIYVDDSQQHASYNSMINEFKSWGTKLSPAQVGYQFGYKADSSWWKPLNDPPSVIGNALFSQIPNAVVMLWVDFTLTSLFPVTQVSEIPFSSVPSMFALYPAYPNPFNPSTTIRFSVPNESHVALTIVDLAGREIVHLADERFDAGTYEVKWNVGNLSSGMYFCQFTSGDFVRTQKIILLR